jgi:hypothetical protein
MKRWRLAAVMIVIVLSGIAFRYFWLEKAAQKREINYQLALAKYSKEFGPGTSRTDVEDHFRQEKIEFGEMCCVEGKNAYTAYSDLIKVGQENPPWYCSENYVYVAFEFTATEPHQLVEAHPSDSLRKVSIFRQLSGCL